MKKKLSIYFGAFIVPMLIMLMGYIFLGIYPFGDKSILIGDMSVQYVEFYGKFYDIFKSVNLIEIIYSWDAGMGDSFLTLMMYYLMSPLGYITLLFPKEYLPESLLFITLIKIGFCGLSFNYLLSFLFKNKNIIYTLMFSTLYALIGYNIAYSFHIMWLDGIYLLPLVIVGVEKIISEKKWQLFFISILLCFVTNFYISYMIGIYSFLYFIIQILLNYRIQEYRPILQRFRLFVLATLLAAGIAAVFLVPTALEVLSNNGGENQIHYNLNSLIFEMGNLGSKFLIGSYTTITTLSPSPQLYCGIIVIPLLIVYFLNRKINRKEKIFYGSLVVFFIISFVDPTLNLLWHAGDVPNWYPSRFSFLFSFTILLMSYKGLVNIQGCKKSLNFVFGITIVLIIAQMILILLLKRLVNGGVFVSTLCFIVTLIFLIIYFFIFKGLLKNKKRTSYLLYGVILIELLVNSTLIFKRLDNELGYVNRGEYEINSTINLLNTIVDDTTTFYRLDNQFGRTDNESLRLGYSGISYFSSMANTQLHEFLSNMGLYMSAGNLSISSSGILPFIDSIFNVRYRITSDGEVIENNVLPLAFPVNRDVLLYESVPNDSIQNQNNLFELMTKANSGEAYLYSSVDFEIESTQNLSYENNTYRKLNTTEPGYLTLLLDKNNIVLQLESSKHINISINNKILEYKSWDNAIYLSEYDSNRIRIEMNEGVTNSNDIKFYSLNKELLDKNIEILKKQSPSTIVVNNNKVLIKGKFQEDEVLFTSIPFEKGWKAKIDGKPIPVESLEEALILIDVPEGEHEIELYYLPQGLLLGGIISIIGIILFIMAIVYDYARSYLPKKKYVDC